MYCDSLTNYNRFLTKEVNIGTIPVGGNNSIRLQTMSNSLTKDIKTTVEQVSECFENGADYVRITTPTISDVQALKEIQSSLKKIFSDKPIIADVHFNPEVAKAAACIANKVRINPGNFIKAQKKYSEKEYKQELNKIESICAELIDVCKKNNTALRIGTNHGSLSNRIITKYGNTEKGLVKATIEYLQICKKLKFNNVVVSIKSSNPTIMVHSNRLLVEEMKKRKLNFPLHLGVTEAGNSKEGRIKSAIGIGALLIDGIGDTIRVSLTESPAKELPVAQKIVNYINQRQFQEKISNLKKPFFDPYSFNRRKTYQISNIGGNKKPVVIADACNTTLTMNEFSPDYIITSVTQQGQYILSNIKTIIPFSQWDKNNKSIPLLNTKDYLKSGNKIDACFLTLNTQELKNNVIEKINNSKNCALIPKLQTNNTIGELRKFYSVLNDKKCNAPVILKLDYEINDIENYILQSAIDSSVFLIDGLADGLLLNNKSVSEPAISIDLAFEILQASHRRLSKTEYISCPSCGRTLFDLEAVTEKVKKATKHLKGLKIAIMGCIVNGPGEVADADYGYIGSGKNSVTLFKGKKPVKKNINEKLAVKELVNLIKENGDWNEP